MQHLSESVTKHMTHKTPRNWRPEAARTLYAQWPDVVEIKLTSPHDPELAAIEEITDRASFVQAWLSDQCLGTFKTHVFVEQVRASSSPKMQVTMQVGFTDPADPVNFKLRWA